MACHVAGSLRSAVDGSMSIQIHSDGTLDILAVGETDAAVRRVVDRIAAVAQFRPDHAPAIVRHGRRTLYVLNGHYLGEHVRATATLYGSAS